MKDVEPTQLTLNSKFSFRCHKGLNCFTKCCRSINILLTPYDIIRMKKRLNLSSDEFLDEYTFMEIDEKSSQPLIRMKMKEDGEKSCPFVTPEGCTIYEDRPANCRYYPVGQGARRIEGKKGPENEEFYFLIREPHCLGYGEATEWTVQSWREDQQASLYDEMNREWKEIQLRRNPLMKKPDSNQQAQLYTAYYDVDRFRRYVLESRFLDVFEIEPEEIEKIQTDDVALMNLGLKYAKFLLLLEKTLKVKEGFQKAK
jgi:uncharacterized protein